ALSDSDAAVREAAVEGLRYFDDRVRSGALFAAVADPSPRVRRSAVGILGQCRLPGTTEALRSALTDGSAEVRLAASLSLCARGERVAEEHVLQALAVWNDADGLDAAWREVAMALARLDRAPFRAALRAHLSSASFMKRLTVVQALASSLGE